VHVWAVAEPVPGAGREEELRRCLGLLSPDELRRRRHVVPSHRALYASAHAALRAVTAAYAGLPPSQVAFVKGAFGKPYVAGDPGLRVSLSHTPGLSLVAVSRDGPVGVDVERVAPLTDPVGLRHQVLSEPEAAAWPEDREDALHSGLFTHWTCKEAVLKALGSGLAGDIRAVRVAPGARRGGPVRVLAAPGRPDRTWTLQLIDCGPGFRAAVAVAGGAETVRVFPLTPGAEPPPWGDAAESGAGLEGRSRPAGPVAPPPPVRTPLTKENPSCS
jgi:4'-phosphopantetheinyl transferase